jgi:hypothetical protein
MDCDETGRDAGGTHWGATVVAVVCTERCLKMSTDCFSLPPLFDWKYFHVSSVISKEMRVLGGMGDGERPGMGDKGGCPERSSYESWNLPGHGAV